MRQDTTSRAACQQLDELARLAERAKDALTREGGDPPGLAVARLAVGAERAANALRRLVDRIDPAGG